MALGSALNMCSVEQDEWLIMMVAIVCCASPSFGPFSLSNVPLSLALFVVSLGSPQYSDRLGLFIIHTTVGICYCVTTTTTATTTATTALSPPPLPP